MNSSMNNLREIRMAMVGPSGSGKSVLLGRLQGRPFTPLYVSTDGTHEWVIDLDEYRFIVTEYCGTRFYEAADFAEVTAYIVVDTPSYISRRYAEGLQRLMPDNIPSAKIVNKSDLYSIPLPEWSSAKNNTNLETAFRSIAHQIYG